MESKGQKALQAQSLFSRLLSPEREFLWYLGESAPFTYQEARQVVIVARDLQMWQCETIREWWGKAPPPSDRASKKHFLEKLLAYWETLKRTPSSYEKFSPAEDLSHRPFPTPEVTKTHKEETILGRCPVASEKTRCCNLHTLDVVQQCGFGCTYCSIQSFYGGAAARMPENLASRLKNLSLDPVRRYHIGTGQSSDSLLWVDVPGFLEALWEFVERNPNLILELKTKSSNIAPLLTRPVNRRIVVTWSLAPDCIIRNEELGTSSLKQRLKAARRVADAGFLVGFHFHPMILHQGWQANYRELSHLLLETFSPKEVMMVSLGCLTFTKSVLKAIRHRGGYSRILKTPLTECAGRYSYPVPSKKALFKLALSSLAPWRGEVFFYLCMEERFIWEKVFGESFPENRDLEQAMLEAYFRKAEMEK